MEAQQEATLHDSALQLRKGVPLVVFLAVSILATLCRAEEQKPVYKDSDAQVDARVEDLLTRMTAEEKIAMMGGTGFTTMSVDRLGIPAFVMSDASMGIRGHGKSTAYANGIALAATWDTALAREAGEALGNDCRARGVHILLGPGMNLYRSPTCGRNFEYAGEDPFLAGCLAGSFIQGLQSKGVAATAKHYIANEQEVQRHAISSNIDERTLRELYLKPFDASVKAGALCVMTSYNPLNGIHTSQNEWIIGQILKKEFGFRGFVMSDWGSCYDARGMANAGLDLEMPRGEYFNSNNIVPLIRDGRVTQAVIDDKVRRQLRVAFMMGWFDRDQEDRSIPKDDPASASVALREARESVTLLKNEGDLLPLDSKKTRKIVLLGHNADPAVYGGAGSSVVDPFHATSILEGVRKIVGNHAEITLVPWKRLGTHPVEGRPEALDANGAEKSPAIPGDSIEAVKNSDAVIVCVGFGQSPPKYRGSSPKMFDQEGEDGDRSYGLPPGQSELIREAAKLNPRTIVVLNAGGSVATAGWVDQIPALLHTYYPGQCGGQAIAEILFGKVNPSGKLPFSWEKRWEDSAAYGHYPAYGEKSPNNDYDEGVFLGYRWFDSQGIKPLYPFGHGLSYTTFEFSDLKVKAGKEGSLKATVTVRNSGKRSGSEIVQLYVEPPASDVPRPVRELRGFARVELQPGESREVTTTFERQDLAYWNPATRGWVVTPGTYHAAAGSSSADLPLKSDFQIAGNP